ncbi:hypothetical protein [uncultured Vagococcus sp.]|uniref:glycoside hydrolase family 30 protein n=1 Tax=uncultured Vagococcus sp. TaxID=189676 RepID=UPI0028D71CEA|nr:hypothetical protein [uncultured Vagococcus sp.]
MIQEEVALGIAHHYLSSAEHTGSDITSWYDQEYPLAYVIAQQPDIPLQEGVESTPQAERVSLAMSSLVDSSVKMRGLGTSLDGASVHHLMTMTAEQRRNFLTTLIDPVNGSGFTQFRLVIGTSDLNAIEQDLFSYYDIIPNGAPNWEEDFSIQPDIEIGLIEVLKELLTLAKDFQIEDEIKFLGSPWSPPGWMKEKFSETEVNNDLKLISGFIKDDHLENWAIYLRRYVEEYAKLDIPIHALTLQNEPGLVNKTYPSCIQTGAQQAKVAKCLRKELANSTILQEKNYQTELWAWDYGTELPTPGSGIIPEFNVDEFLESLESVDPGLSQFDGIAFHGYNYLSLIQRKIKEISERYPDKAIHLTEGMENGTLGANRIIINLRQNCSSFYHWVTCLDQDGRPNEWENSPNMVSWKTLNVALAIHDSETYWFLPTKNAMGQIARFVRPGYEMIPTESDISLMENVAYYDRRHNNIIWIISSDLTSQTILSIPTINGQQFHVTLPGHSISTLIFSAKN